MAPKLGGAWIALIGKGKYIKSLTSASASAVARKDNKTKMSQSVLERHQQLGRRLRMQVLRAEEEVNQASPERQEEALQHYEVALYRFSRLVAHRHLNEESGAR
jgi:hypothetical protein